jgi:antitoxin component YwqK of YwqJK toxin-antitoxin module
MFSGFIQRLFFIIILLFYFGSDYISAQTEFKNAHDSINWVDSKGMKQGKFRKTDKDGKTIYEGYFRNNNPYGTFKYFDEDGKITAINVFSKDGKSSHTKMFHRNGNIMAKGKYLNQLRDSVWEFYSEDTLVSREGYLGGKKNGISITYFKGAGILEQSTWKNGVEEGPYKEFYPDGKLKKEGNYVNGCLSGIVIYYCENGNKHLRAVYKDCLPEGDWLYYKCGTGEFYRKVHYKKGKVIGPPLHDIDKQMKEGLEENKERNEKEHEGGPGKEDKDGAY